MATDILLKIQIKFTYTNTEKENHLKAFLI